MPEPAIAEASSAPVDVAVAEPIESTVEVPSGEPQADTQEVVTQDTPEQDTQADISEDGRLIPQKYRDLFKQDKQLKQVWFTEKAYRAQFPTPAEATKAREFIQQVGGEEGFQGLQAQVQELEQIDQRVANADPQLIADIAKETPEGFSKLMGPALEQWYQADPEAYQHVLGRAFYNTLSGAGVAQALQQLGGLVKDNPQAAQVVNDLLGWTREIQELATHQPVKKVDPERQKFEAEKKAWQTEKENTFRAGVRTEVGTFLKSAIKTELDKYNKAISPEAYGFIERNVHTELNALLVGDAQFQKQNANLLTAMDKAKVIAFQQSRLQKVLPEAVKKVYRVFNAAGGQKAADTQRRVQQNQARTDLGSGGAPVTKMAGKPDNNQIDWGRTTSTMVLDGKAFLKGRKDQVNF